MNTLIDSGPLVALFNKRDQWHRWALKQSNKIESSFITCEAVISECLFRLNYAKIDPTNLLEFIKRGDLNVQPAFSSNDAQKRVSEIIINYQNIPADFADACLVYMVEAAKRETQIFTADSHLISTARKMESHFR